jgi:hypothetical protein
LFVGHYETAFQFEIIKQRVKYWNLWGDPLSCNAGCDLRRSLPEETTHSQHTEAIIIKRKRQTADKKILILRIIGMHI